MELHQSFVPCPTLITTLTAPESSRNLRSLSKDDVLELLNNRIEKRNIEIEARDEEIKIMKEEIKLVRKEALELRQQFDSILSKVKGLYQILRVRYRKFLNSDNFGCHLEYSTCTYMHMTLYRVRTGTWRSTVYVHVRTCT